MTDQQLQLAGVLVSLGVALPVSVVWVWLICRDHERLAVMRPEVPAPDSRQP